MSTPQSGERPSVSWKTHAAFMLFCTVGCVAWSWWAGRDLNWDQLNYHIYAAYHFLEDRIAQDFMGASIQGYLNPLAYVPFYLMVRADWHSLVIGSTLALLHSTCLWLIYAISRILIPDGTRYRTAMIAASVVLAFLSPLYLAEVGSSFIDVTTTIPVLAGILLLMICHQRDQCGLLVAAAGLVMGSAAALKLTNVIFALAACAFIVMATIPIRQRIYGLVAYAAGGLAGFLLFEGAWAYRMFKTFGNPFFPWFNGWFRSPDFPLFTIQHHRFLAETVGDYVLFPFRILDLYKRTYTEVAAPDIRFAALFLILLALAVMLLVQGGRRQPSSAAAPKRAPPAFHPYRPALGFTLLSYILWLATSGNGRYAIPLELFMGPMIPASLLAFNSSGRAPVYVTGIILLVQAAIVQVAVEPRWMPAKWKLTWYDVNVPEALRTRPFLFLSLHKQTNAFLAPLLNHGSSFVNLSGHFSLALDRPGGARLRALLDHHRPYIRTLFLPSIPAHVGKPHPTVITFQNNLLKRVGLQVDTNDCQWLQMNDLVGQIPETMSEPSGSGLPRMPDKTNYLSCATMPLQDSAETPQFAARRARDDRAFDLLEAMCPKQFNPAGPYTDHVNEKLARAYFNTDASVSELNGVVEYEGWRYDAPIPLGSVDDILEGKLHLNCRAILPPVGARN